MSNVTTVIQRLMARAQAVEGPALPSPCGADLWESHTVIESDMCDGAAHYRRSDDRSRMVVYGRCPAVVKAEIQARVDSERKRLAGPIARLIAAGGEGFDGYDPCRHAKARAALESMRRFATGRPPAHGVLLSGTTGLGKTRLLLASHFALLSAGINSHYVTAGDLRDWYRDGAAFAEARREAAEQYIDRLTRAQALHLDDLGDVRGSDAFHANFAAGLKGLLDSTSAALAVAFNCNSDDARRHPDIGDRVLSRLVENADIVAMDGDDQRVETARGAT